MLIPVKEYRTSGGVYTLPDAVTLASPRRADDLPLAQLARALRALGRRSQRQLNAVAPAAVRMLRTATGAAEGYRIEITPRGVAVSSHTDAGAYYALQTLRALVVATRGRLRCGVINDAPDFARRGVYLDCARGKVPALHTLLALVERLAHWKINELQLYIENVFAFTRHPAIGRGFSPFTAHDIVALDEQCARHHVRLVPSLASFGHLETVLALPRYRALGELPGTLDKPGGTTLCPGDPGSLRLLEELYEEFLPLFTAREFNVCCDETWELGKGRSKARAARVGVGRVYLDFLLKIHRLCQRHGMRMNAWADIVLEHPELLSGVPRDVVMLNWEYGAHGARIPRTKEIVRAGLPCVVCPGTSGWNSHGTRLDNAMQNVAAFAAVGRTCRVEGLLNTDWGDGGHRNTLGVSMHGFAHGAAHAWHGRGVDDATFTERYCAQSFAGCDARALANAIRALGGVQSSLGCASGKGCAPYHMLVEPLDPRRDIYRGINPRSPVRVPRAWQGSHAACATERELAAVVELLGTQTFWPAAPAGLAAFERQTLADYAIAARMDALAARRGLAIRALRAGQSIPAQQWRALADDTRAVARDFARAWLARNRPSRLRDNLLLLQRAEAECRCQARN